ncbi:actin cytoskeleton-regulatory complex protein PAN1-like isoform X2 [Gymnodraco acuticeps]|uniref:Actin cytoskeleton-regulatory complex protein PAN1-like isoform X2 n=1 Tax=Gymnodraco acuticeps TaxID=8218 RepID=A0A6P8UW79_GYMAC|nr:actin cytoskeleton-regulatory complex protein PAN1-like isoform X2 [Gymnodraco acuticeps]
MHEDDRLLCILCQRSEQTKITGALSTKEDVTAHQNCLLFSSALFCRNTPQFDDLFGFSVDDVFIEVKRGRQLICNKCKKRGATVGCEVRRCKKSYHYPCAVEERAKIVEDVTKEEYVLYCYKHYPKTEENNPSENGSLALGSKSRAYRNPEEARTSKVYCLTCEKSEGNISLESLSYSVVMSYCDKHAPGSHKKNASGDSTNQRPTVYSSDSNSSSSRKPSSIKRQLSFRDKQNGTPSKRSSKVSWASLRDDSSNSGNNEPDSITAPLDTDIDDSEHLVGEPLTRETHFCLEEESRDEDETEAESESLLPPFSQPLPASQADFPTQTPPMSPVFPPSEVWCKTERQTQADDGGSLHMNKELELCCCVMCAVSPEESPVDSPSDPHTAGPSPSALTDAGSSACVTLPTSCSPPVAPPSPVAPPPMDAPPPCVAPPPDPSPSGASRRFWRSCNAAGCTQNIFRGFYKEISDVSDRIQAEQASQEDYDLALTVMRASGKLLELVVNQQEELQGKQRELQEAAAAMEEAVSALRRDEEQLS